MLPLPIDPLLPDVVAHLRAKPRLVLEAPPGAGKTTRIPRALLDADFPGEIVVLEPRRLAARMAAGRVAEELGEEVGKRVGYQVRFEDIGSAATRVRFVTEAILTRRLLSDPSLSKVGAVVLDEFHERHLHGDVALSCLKHLQETRRDDLRLVVMSATLDARAAAEFLACDVLRAEGRRFDVTLEHLPSEDDRPLDRLVASAVRTLLADGLDGDVLVFLPGAGEIRRAKDTLEPLAREHDLLLLPLHGELPPTEQDRAVRRADRRKIILSTNVAESSVTIDGIVAVIDGGLARVATHDPWSGLPRLELAKVSRASAVQRAGRAGRTRAGRCLRLYTKADFDRRPEHDAPEILRHDLSSMVLELRASDVDPRTLKWLDAPPAPALTAAEELLGRLGALDAKGPVTSTGRRMVRFPVHPRTARLLVEAEDRGAVDDAAVVAAILGERDLRVAQRARFGDAARDLLPTERSDLLALTDLFREAEGARFSDSALRSIGLDVGATRAVDRAQKQLRRACRTTTDARGTDDDLLACILAGYPDRVARRLRRGARALAVAGGTNAELAEESVVRDAEWMVAVQADDRAKGARGPSRVRLASAIEPEWLIDLFPDRIGEARAVTFARGAGRVEVVSRMTYDGLTLSESTAADASEEEIARALADAAVTEGADSFAPEGALARFRDRARFATEVDPSLPPVTDELVREALVDLCYGKRSFAEVRQASLLDAVMARLGAAACAKIASFAPERLTLSRGRSVKVEYELGKPPHVASRLQDFFGMKETPRVGGGKVAVVVHLLAPNQRAVQVTSDLAGFWERHYPSIRKELARKYPRHAWPEKPED